MVLRISISILPHVLPLAPFCTLLLCMYLAFQYLNAEVLYFSAFILRSSHIFLPHKCHSLLHLACVLYLPHFIHLQESSIQQ